MPRRKKAKIRQVGLVVHPRAPGAVQRARRLGAWLARRGIEVLADEPWARGADGVRLAQRQAMMREADIVVVLGGDGSLLGVARLSRAGAAPVIGIHHGDFGFLTDAEDDGPYAVMERVLAGDFEVERRTMLSVRVRRGAQNVAAGQALNDAVVARGTLSRMVTLEASVDDEYLATYMGDGLIIATPTGSTAYSLSAGGPIVEPTMSALLITPISAHTLNSRPVVVSDRSLVRVRIGAGGDVILSLDGQESVDLEEGDLVEVRRAPHRAAIAKVSADGFFSILRRKLNWGARGESRLRHARKRRG